MASIEKCHTCLKPAVPEAQDFFTPFTDSLGQAIVVPDVIFYHCYKCGHKWLSAEQESIIDKHIAGEQGRLPC